LGGRIPLRFIGVGKVAPLDKAERTISSENVHLYTRAKEECFWVPQETASVGKNTSVFDVYQGIMLFAEIIFVSPQDNFFVRVVWISLSSRIEYCSRKRGYVE
jgi:hypothetical protein